MKKTVKRVTISLFSVMGFSCVLWAVLFLNPSLSYANKTQIGQVTIFHNQDLKPSAEEVLNNVIEILKGSKIYDESLNIQLCLNDDKIYPNLYPIFGHPLAYAIFNKTIIKNGEIKFNENLVEVQWKGNNELRKYNLTWLLTHEFTHNLQKNANPDYVRKTTKRKINWKLEGHADYIARKFKNDGRLKEKMEKYLIQENNEYSGLPAIKDEVGTYLTLGNYKYALMIQFLMEEKKMNYTEICKLEAGFDELFSQMTEWSKK